MDQQRATDQEQPWSREEARQWIVVPAASDDKYSRGVLGVVSGSHLYPGAAVLGVEAAVRTGVGMVRYVGDARAAEFVLQRRPEVVTAGGRVQAWLLGSGMDAETRSSEDTQRLRTALADAVPVVIDAGALDLIGEATGPVVITPHFRELSRTLAMSGIDASPAEIADAPVAWAQRAANDLSVTVLLKGHLSVAASPDGTVLTAQTAPSWLATAGSGDVLAGILGALVATHFEQIDEHDHASLCRLAATASVLHGLAARRASGGGPIAALDIAEAMPATIAELLHAPEA